MKKPKNIIKVTITKEHLDWAGNYLDSHNCVLATALKELGYHVHGVGGYYARITYDNVLVKHYMSDIDADKVEECYSDSSLLPFTVTLTKRKEKL